MRSMSSRAGMWQATQLNRVRWGNAAENLVDEVDVRGKSRVFIIASGTLTRLGEISQIEQALGEKHVGTARVGAHVCRQDVLAAAAAARATAPDILVSVGGGSITDGTKAINMCLARNVESSAQFDPVMGHGVYSPPNWEHSGQICHVAIPTTLSGAEFLHVGGVTDDTDPDKPQKQLFGHPMLTPQAVIYDADLSLHTPDNLWLTTGMRSIDHCTEALCSTNANPLSDAVATAALPLLANALRQTKSNPDDLDARLRAMIGCWQSMGPIVMGVKMGASHGIGHALGAAGVGHGETSCIGLPCVLKWNEDFVPHQSKRVAELLGAKPHVTAAQAMHELILELKLPRTLADVGFPMDSFDLVCEKSLANPWVQSNPRPITEQAHVAQILAMYRDGI